MKFQNNRSNFQTALLSCIAVGFITVVALYSFQISQEFDHLSAEAIGKLWQKKKELTGQMYEMSDKEKRLFEKLESIHKSCGEVCSTKIYGSPGKVRYKNL